MIQKEIQICLNAITNDDFISEYSQFHDSELLNVEMVANVCDWCVDYYREFEKAPRKNIQKIFINKISGLSEEVQEQTKDFLSNLSDKYEKLSVVEDVDFEIKEAVEHLQRNRLKQTAMSITDSLDNIERAKEIVENHTNITLESNKVLDFFEDDEAIESAFRNVTEPLLKYSGAFGQMFNEFLTKGALVGIMAPEKRGKTFFTINILLQALKYMNNVVYFGVGDMSKEQMLIRICITLAQKSNKVKYCKSIKYPIKACYIDDIIEVVYDQMDEVEPLTYEESIKVRNLFKELIGNTNFKLKCYPTDSVTVSELKAVCKEWKRKEGFIADVVIIDYADILLPEKGNTEFRHQENSKWKALRNWSLDEELNLPLVITPTQTDADSVKVETLSRSNFSEDKRKFSHATMFLGLNQTEEEKKKKVMRANTVLAREGDFIESDCCTMLQCLARGQFMIESFWKSTDENLVF